MEEKKNSLGFNLSSKPLEARRQCKDIFKTNKQPIHQNFHIQQNHPSEIKAKNILDQSQIGRQYFKII